MNRCDCATAFHIVDGLDLIKQERKRQETVDWPKTARWLAKTDEQHLQEELSVSNWTTEYEDIEEFDKQQDDINDAYCCAICFEPKRYLLVTEFSFCQEYGCGMHICKECAIKLGELAKKIPELGDDDK